MERAKEEQPIIYMPEEKLFTKLFTKVLFTVMRLSRQEEESEVTDESLPSLEEVEDIIGYKFKYRNLLQQAFTHTTYRDDSCSSYKRLEYVGDSAKEHYSLYSDLGLGMLTRLRAPNFDKEKLARVAVKHNLDKYMRHKKPLLDRQVSNFFYVFLSLFFFLLI